MKNSKIIKIQKYEQITNSRAKLSLLLSFNGRTISYDVIVNQSPQGNFEI